VEIGILQEELNRIVGHELNVSSSKQVANYFYIEKGHRAFVSRKTGAVSADDAALTKLAIEGFDEELAEELQSRATEALDRREEAARSARRELGVEDALAELPHLTEAMLVTLGKAGIKTLDDLADLATDELIAKKRIEQRRRDGSAPARRSARDEDKGGVLGDYGLSEEQGNEIIMAARAHWFEDEPAVEEAADADSSQ
jgi:N utilization substance protein A